MPYKQCTRHCKVYKPQVCKMISPLGCLSDRQIILRTLILHDGSSIMSDDHQLYGEYNDVLLSLHACQTMSPPDIISFTSNRSISSEVYCTHSLYDTQINSLLHGQLHRQYFSMIPSPLCYMSMRHKPIRQPACQVLHVIQTKRSYACDTVCLLVNVKL